MAEYKRGTIDNEYYEQAVQLAEFDDDDRLVLSFWLPAGFRIDRAMIRGAQGCDGARVAIGDGEDIDRWGALASVDGHNLVELSAGGDPIVRQRTRPTLTVQDVTPAAHHAGGFTVRVYGQTLE